MAAEYIEASKARFGDKKVVLEYPSTVRQFSIEDLPDDLKGMGFGGAISVHKMSGGQLRAFTEGKRCTRKLRGEK